MEEVDILDELISTKGKIPIGTYQGVIENFEHKTTLFKGTPYTSFRICLDDFDRRILVVQPIHIGMRPLWEYICKNLVGTRVIISVAYRPDHTDGNIQYLDARFKGVIDDQSSSIPNKRKA